jgi:hypothetical protein
VSVPFQELRAQSWTILTSPSYVPMPLSTSPDANWGASDYASLSQKFVGGTAGEVYFLTVQVNLPEMVGEGSCELSINAGSQAFVSYSYGISAQHGSVNASGILKSTPSSLDLSVSCSDYSGSPTDLIISFGNAQLSVYDPSIGSNPIRPVAGEALVNNAFESGTLFPWTTYSTTGRMDFSAVNGRAVITYSRIRASFTSPAWISQTLDKPAEEGQNVRIRADVYMKIPNAGTRCLAQVFFGGPAAWSINNVAATQSFHIDVSQTLTSGSQLFYLFGSCTGTGATTSISFDNVYYTVNVF